MNGCILRIYNINEIYKINIYPNMENLYRVIK